MEPAGSSGASSLTRSSADRSTGQARLVAVASTVDYLSHAFSASAQGGCR